MDQKKKLPRKRFREDMTQHTLTQSPKAKLVYRKWSIKRSTFAEINLISAAR